MTNLPDDRDTRQLPRAVRGALADYKRGQLPATLTPVLVRRLALSVRFGELAPGRLPRDLVEPVHAAVAELNAGRWPGWRAFVKDQTALERQVADDGERSPAELLALAQVQGRLHAAAWLRAHRAVRGWGLRAYLLAEDRATPRGVRRALGSNAGPRLRRATRGSDRERAADAEVLTEALTARVPDVIGALDLQARLDALAAIASPAERAVLAEMRRDPEATDAEIGVRLHKKASTVRVTRHRLRARAASL